MKIICITHADFENPGSIESWAEDRGHDFKIVRPYRGERLPELADYQALIIMGGPQSVIRMGDYPYLQDEVNYIQAAIEKKMPVIGFCLGAQLIGQALGAAPEKSPEKEIGVFPIHLTEKGLEDPVCKDLGANPDVIHWHSDMPGLTEDADILAKSPGCPRQIIRYRPHVYGFQCHVEIDQTGIQALIQAAPEDLEPSAYTQDEKTLLSQDYAPINAASYGLMDRFLVTAASF